MIPALLMLICIAILRADAQSPDRLIQQHRPIVIHLEEPAPGVEALRLKVGDRPGLFLFDSGIGVSLLTPEMAKATGCQPWGKLVGFRATGERIDLLRCNGTPIQIGEVHVLPPVFGIFDLAPLVGPAGKEISGAIGLDAFAGKVITLSVASRTLTVEGRQSAKRIAATEQEIPIRLVRDVDGAALGADVGVSTPKGVVWFEIDTGNDGPSFVDRSIAPLLSLQLSEDKEQNLHLADDLVSFSGPCVVTNLVRDGNLGRSALKEWDITLDLARGRGWIKRADATRSHTHAAQPAQAQ